MALDFKDKSFLVIDDFKELLEGTKSMLSMCGAVDIDTHMSGQEAINLMNNKQYDVILCDYHLRTGKNGQQILEQARHDKLLKHSAVFLIVTAECNPLMVLGALEYQPDDYIMKPVNTAILRSRIEKSLKIKHQLAPIHAAIDNEDYAGAILYCDKAIAKSKRFAIPCLKLKSEVFLLQEKYQEAKEIFESVLADNKLNWATFGLGKCLYGLSDYKEAVTIFTELISENKTFMQAYDWKSRSELALGEKESAIETLKLACSISPHAIIRQKNLGKLAIELNDYELAENCFRHVIDLGRHSVYKAPENYTTAARTIMHNYDSDADTNTKSSNDLYSILKEGKKEYENDASFAVEANMLESQSHQKLGNEQEAKACLEKAMKALENTHNIPEELAKEMVNTCKVLREDEKVEKIAKQLSQDLPDSSELRQEMTAMIESSPLNAEGMELYRAQKYEDALAVFAKAVAEYPDSISINLNAAQTVIKVIEQNGVSNDLLQLFVQYIRAVQHINSSDQRFPRYQELMKIYTKYVEKG